MRAILALCVPVLAMGCHDDVAKPAAAGPATSASTKAPASTFGRPIEGGETASLVDIAKNPTSYKGRVVATEGTVTRVCQERGCWMAIKDDSGTATVRMHGHTFFVPTTSAGKHARVEGTVVLMKDGRECDDLDALDAKLELDATGVELM
jgi:RNase P/RNase MRP subunit p29